MICPILKVSNKTAAWTFSVPKMTSVSWILLTHQLDDLDENPVIGGGGHEFEEEWGQRQVVLGISASQLTDNVYCCRLDTWGTENNVLERIERCFYPCSTNISKPAMCHKFSLSYAEVNRAVCFYIPGSGSSSFSFSLGKAGRSDSGYFRNTLYIISTAFFLM